VPTKYYSVLYVLWQVQRDRSELESKRSQDATKRGNTGFWTTLYWPQRDFTGRKDVFQSPELDSAHFTGRKDSLLAAKMCSRAQNAILHTLLAAKTLYWPQSRVLDSVWFNFKIRFHPINWGIRQTLPPHLFSLILRRFLEQERGFQGLGKARSRFLHNGFGFYCSHLFSPLFVMNSSILFVLVSAMRG
jgi:hypothetical protein